MWDRVRAAISALLALVILAAIGYGLFEFIRLTLVVFESLDRTVAAAFITALATVLASTLAIILTNLYSANLKRDERVASKKIPIYEGLLRFIFRFLGPSSTAQPVSEAEVAAFAEKFNLPFMVWGADAVVAAFVKWRRFGMSPSAVAANPQESLFLFGDLILAIRRDLGHKNSRLASADVLALFINDIDSAPPRRRSK